MTLLREILNIPEPGTTLDVVDTEISTNQPETIEENFASVFKCEDEAEIEVVDELDGVESNDGHEYDSTCEEIGLFDNGTNTTTQFEVLVLQDNATLESEMLEYAVEEEIDDEVIKCESIPITVETDEQIVSPRPLRPRGKEACRICGSMEAKSHMSAHLDEHDETMSHIIQPIVFYRCDRCRVIHMTLNSFVQHMVESHNCEEILKQYTDTQCREYQFLEGEHSDNPTERILTCSTVICTQMSENYKYTCFCEFQTRKFDDFCDHFKEEHMNDGGELLPMLKETCHLSHACGICNKTFRDMKETIFHVYCHNEHYKCPYACNKMLFKTLKSLQRHVRLEHLTGDLKYVCQHCNLAVVSQELLRKHVKSECNGRSLKCKLCRKYLCYESYFRLTSYSTF